MWPVFSSEWQWSRKKAGCVGILPSPDPGMDSLPPGSRHALWPDRPAGAGPRRPRGSPRAVPHYGDDLLAAPSRGGAGTDRGTVIGAGVAPRSECCVLVGTGGQTDDATTPP